MRSPYRPYQKYTVELAITMSVYVVTVFVSTSLLNLSLPSLLRISIALLPMIPASFVVVVVVRLLQRVDEFHRRFHLETLGFAFAGTGLLTFSYGFLQTVGFPHTNWFWVWGVMGIMWLIGGAWSTWRYR